MDKPKWTPGPWIRSKHGFNILTADSRQSIAAVHAIHPGHSSEKDHEEQIANASLISASTEMYDALSSLLGWATDRGFRPNHPNSRLIAAHNALAKARGES